MLNLDEKVSRDSIFISGNELGFFKKIKRRVKKVKSMVSRAVFPKFARKIAKKLESKHRKKLKMVGGAAAIGTAAFFAGPAVLTFAKGAGGKALVAGIGKNVGGQVLGAAVAQQIQKKMSKDEEKLLKAEMATMPPQEVLSDPRIVSLGLDVSRSIAKNPAQKIMLQEGAFEVGHQVKKSMMNTKNIAIVGGGVAAMLLAVALVSRGGK